MASPRSFPCLLALVAAGFFAGTAVMAKPVSLPVKAPIPQPDERPAEAPATDEMPAKIPVPPQKPTDAGKSEKPAEAVKEPEKTPMPADPRSDIRPIDPMPKQEVACRERLKSLGVEFEERKPVHDEEKGCSIPYPLTVKTLGAKIDVTPEAEMNCQMAEASARFIADTISPAAKARFGAGLKSINQASAYVCRPRHNGQKMSEHAFGNALDIASFTLTDGKKIDIEPMPEQEGVKKFLADLRKAACGPFKTVLGPGSDPDHELHFHLDLEPRRNGGTFCQ
ncbi:MAG: extensin family protein [Mesorhizobium sp.]